VNTIEELLGRKSSGSDLETREMQIISLRLCSVLQIFICVLSFAIVKIAPDSCGLFMPFVFADSGDIAGVFVARAHYFLLLFLCAFMKQVV
jgi:hypothetical protein